MARMLSSSVISRLREQLVKRGTSRPGSLRDGCGDAMDTFVQLRASAKESVRRIKDAQTSLEAELRDLRSQIPLLVRSIWGGHSEAIVDALRSRRSTAAQLIRRWEDAEHRLIAVANSLTTMKTGQKLVAIGAPMAAARIMQGDSAVYCYHSPTAPRAVGSSTDMITLHKIKFVVACIAQAVVDELSLLQRSLYLFFLFLPAVLTAPMGSLSDSHRTWWLGLVLWSIERAGPAFVKWGQWAATRPDLFSPDVCNSLSSLQTNAPSHAFQRTRRTVEAAFGQPLESLFTEFDKVPVASGSIAQVHRAVLSKEGARRARRVPRGGTLLSPTYREAATFCEGASVAVKVRHPGVSEIMERDFALMQRGATLLSLLPGDAGPLLKESLMQFGAPMREQLDLRCEAEHLHRFAENFKWWSGVRFPLPAARPLVASDVLVESFEEGRHISHYVGTPGRHNKKLADLGLHCYLKMLLKDNFIHADLHPGNILVRLEPALPGSLFSKGVSAIGWDLQLPRLVLLDVGMTACLTSDDQRNLLSFFKSLTSMDGGAIADSMLCFAESASPDPRAFRAEMTDMFSVLDTESLRLNTQEVIADMMDTVRRHGLHLKGIVSTVVITTMVLEGWSTKLNPEIRILETLRDTLPTAWTDRMNSSVDRVVGDASLMLA